VKRRKPRHGLQIGEILVVADIEAARVARRLEVPWGIPSAAQRVVNQMTALLAREDRGMQGWHVPAPRHFGQKFAHARRVRKVGCEIAPLVRVVLQVVELVRIGGLMHELVPSAFDHHQGGDRPFREILADDFVPAGASRELRRQTIAIERRREALRVAAGELAQRR
jgi:hypothetical protein